MENKKLCSQLHRIAFKSCLMTYYENKDRNDIYEYWLYLMEAKRVCEAKGVQKVLELIELQSDINGKD